VAILDQLNAVVAGWGFDEVRIPSGVHELALHLDELPLRPSVYTLLTALYDQGNNLTGWELLDQWYAVPPLVVDTKPVSHLQDRWAGVLNVPGRLEMPVLSSPCCDD
jgi:hypothetical protein